MDAHFEVDGVRADTQHVVLPPLGTATVESRQRLDAPGAHHVTVALQPDDLPLDDGIRLEADLSTLIAQTEDAREGPRAFAEKREPQWRGS